MTIHLVTFSGHHMNRSRQLCIGSALSHGVNSIAGPHYFDPALEYRDGFTLEWLKSQSIYKQMGEKWWAQRGIGFWLWKPYIIDLVMSKLRDGDYLVYSDAGVEFIDNIRYIIDRMDQDVWLFGNNWEHAHWCKRDVLDALMPRSVQCPACHKWCGGAAKRMPCEAGYYYHPTIGKQVQASVIFFRVSDYSRKFIHEWDEWCLCSKTVYRTIINEDGLPHSFPISESRLIDDSPSIAPNHPEFREHRHDQAILTTLAYREGIRLHYWAARYNDGAFTYEKLPEYASDDYPVLFNHHRRRDDESK